MNLLCNQTMNQENLQNVRLFIDVLLLGPMMIYFSYQPGPSKLVREFFFWAGTGTIALNAINYLCVKGAMENG